MSNSNDHYRQLRYRQLRYRQHRYRQLRYRQQLHCCRTWFGIGAVLFDLDGTLVHAPIDFPRMKEVALALAAEAGLDPGEFKELDILTVLSTAAPRTRDPDMFLERADAALIALELEACEDATEAGGATETLEWLVSGGVRVGIVTRNCAEAVARVLRRFPLPHHALLTRADTPRVKPDPLHLRLALQQLGVEPEAAVMVGDHLMDVRAGRAAGMRTIGVLAPGRPADYFRAAEPDAVIRALPELRRWISP